VEFHFQNKFEKLVHLVGFIIRKFVTKHGHVNVKLYDTTFSCYTVINMEVNFEINLSTVTVL
jgi:predicted aspartyl protease